MIRSNVKHLYRRFHPIRCRRLQSQLALTAWSEELSTRLLGRKTITFDGISPVSSNRLTTVLSDYLTGSEECGTSARVTPTIARQSILPPTSHYLHFEPTNPVSRLLPDGTNPEHSPGPPFERRLWAGGAVTFNPHSKLHFHTQAVCVEGTESVSIRGPPGDERAHVSTERRYAHLDPTQLETMAKACSNANTQSAIEQELAAQLWLSMTPSKCAIIEKRNTVFLRQSGEVSPAQPTRLLRPRYSSDLFSHTVIPDRSLLFRYSALTFNAHAIHLDTQWCRDKEGYKNLVVQGTLGLTLLVEKLCQTLQKQKLSCDIASIEYRNLAVMYCDEPVRLCGHCSAKGVYRLWAETATGGMAIKATVRLKH